MQNSRRQTCGQKTWYTAAWDGDEEQENLQLKAPGAFVYAVTPCSRKIWAFYLPQEPSAAPWELCSWQWRQCKTPPHALPHSSWRSFRFPVMCLARRRLQKSKLSQAWFYPGSGLATGPCLWTWTSSPCTAWLLHGPSHGEKAYWTRSFVSKGSSWECC